MFKRLKRIEALMEKFVAGEQECLRLVIRRDTEYALWKLAQSQTWKCDWPGCAVAAYHIHSIISEAPTQSDAGAKQ